MHEFRTRRKIEFVDTDMGGIVHFSRFLIFMETAEHEFLEAIGTRVDLELDGCKIGWPRVAVACRYKSPARFGETLDIHLRVIRKGTSSVTYGFAITADGREISTGESTAVCCEMQPGRDVRSIPIPDSVAEQIEEAPA